MRARGLSLALVVCVPFLVPVAGCHGSDPVAGPTSDPDVVQLAAARAAVAASDAGGAADTVAGLMSALTPIAVTTGNPATAAARSLSGSSSLQGAIEASSALSCPSSGDLESGVTFTCIDEAGSLRFTYGGNLDSSRGSVTLEGSLVATPAGQQTAAGTRFDLEFSASTSGPGGSASWIGNGFVLVSDSGQVVDFRLSMTHTAAAPGGGTAVSTITVTPDALDVLVSAGAVAVRFVLDRSTLSGTVQVNGTLVASVTGSGGCLVVDYLDGSRPNETICP